MGGVIPTGGAGAAALPLYGVEGAQPGRVVLHSTTQRGCAAAVCNYSYYDVLLQGLSVESFSSRFRESREDKIVGEKLYPATVQKPSGGGEKSF